MQPRTSSVCCTCCTLTGLTQAPPALPCSRLPGDHFLVHQLGAREVDLSGGLLPRPGLHRLRRRVGPALSGQHSRRRGGQLLQRPRPLLLRRWLLLLLLLQAWGDAHPACRRERCTLLLPRLLLHGRSVLLLLWCLRGLLHGRLLSWAGRCAVLLLRWLLRKRAGKRRPILLWRRCAAARVAAGHTQSCFPPSKSNAAAWLSRCTAQRAAGRLAKQPGRRWSTSRQHRSSTCYSAAVQRFLRRLSGVCRGERIVASSALHALFPGATKCGSETCCTFDRENQLVSAAASTTSIRRHCRQPSGLLAPHAGAALFALMHRSP